MASKRFFLLACSAPVLLFTACESVPKLEDAQYWQRASASEAVYIRGAKAQQILNRDIGRCVTELRELERLGALKNAIPVDNSGRVLDPDMEELEDWDTPERDRDLLAEHTNYHDFEGCMLAAGWERTEYVPYSIAEKARDIYIQEHVDYGYASRVKKPKKPPTTNEKGDFSDLNE